MTGAVEKHSSAAFPSPFVAAAYVNIRLTPQDSGALHLATFEQPQELGRIFPTRLNKECYKMLPMVNAGAVLLIAI